MKPKASRRLRITFVVFGVLATIVIVCVLILDALGKRGVEAELERWRASGDPLLALQDEPADPTLPEPLQRWLDLFATEPCDSCDPMMLADEIAAFSACAQPFEASHCGEVDFNDTCLAALQDPVRARALTDCERALIEARCESALECAVLAPTARELPAFPGERRLRGGRPLQDILEPSPIPPMIAAARFASCAVRLHLIRGESEAALDALREDFEIARVASGLPLIPGFDAWGFDLGIALTGLRESLQFLPPSTDLSWYEHELDGIDPRAVLVRAVRQDRLAGHNTIRAFTGAGLPDERRDSVDTLQAWLARRFLLIDHGVYLESFRRALEHLESEHWREAPTRPFEAKAPWPASHYQAMSRLLTPEFERHIDYAMELEAKVALARAALVNHRDGTNAARAWLAARSDPFDGAPLRSRVDPDGVLVMWSIGHDRVDDGAPRRSNRCESGPFVDVDWLVLAR